MIESNANISPSHDEEYNNSCATYLQRAIEACEAGDTVLAMHLYLAAFESAPRSNEEAPSENALGALKRAWTLACTLRERSMAEYIFERLQPYMTSEETAVCADQLQDLALDKLEEIGLSRENLQEMTDFISKDLLEGANAQLMGVHQLTMAPKSQNVSVSSSEKNSLSDTVAADKPSAAGMEPTSSSKGISSSFVEPSQTSKSTAAPATKTNKNDHIDYSAITGYDKAVSLMRDFGIGMSNDETFQQLVSQLNARHGLDRMPASDAFLFRAPAREDATRFMVATMGELNLPAIRMRMEDGPQGMPMLCVMTQADRQPKLNAAKTAFEGPGVLLLEDLDLWTPPMEPSPSDDLGGIIVASLSRGARDTVGLIRSAVESPDVYVLASAAESSEIDPFFYDLIEPLSIIDIDYPTASERADIWLDITRKHPSLRGIDRTALVRYSQAMPRHDMYMAAKDAVEEAYRNSLTARHYIPVTSGNLFDKLAAYHPLDSDEYRELEEAVVSGFRRDLDHLEDLLEEDGK